MLPLSKPSRSLLSRTRSRQHLPARCRPGAHRFREFSRTGRPNSARPTVYLTPLGHTENLHAKTPPASRRIRVHALPLALLHTIPVRISTRTFSISSATWDNSRDTSDIMSNNANGAAAPASSWAGHQGAAAFDLRSDTMTTPTAAMLSAIQTTTLLDDVFEEDPTTIDLEAHVAALTGKEAGLFVLSGTMGNQVALRALLTQPPHSILCDRDSHINKYEAGGVASLSQALLITVRPRNGRYLTLEDVQENVVLGDNVHGCPTRVISLENTLNGMIMPLAEVQRISAFAREHSILMHCDGARLWEAVVSGAGSLLDFCACFDTISLCFSKGLGAPIGSIVVGSKKYIKHGRWVRKAIGGGLRQSGVVTAAARVAVDTTFGKDPNGQDGLLKASHTTARRVEKMWTDLGGRMQYPVETNMCWLDLESLNCSAARFQKLGQEAGLKLSGNRLITHYQIGEEAIQRLAAVFQQVAQEKGANSVQPEKSQTAGIYGK
ncbi:pyridoxal phosphate-dependent transferase [Xylaria bambusicola]|uniref:pyridoxal phosphate-dependent transferase n=1 Tax=Xylaria bambusicola TaxID=326684 RepID=UPI002007B50D|nr:pyridoxal phosphate-dependent transferase [Xylaria bambusicola]KAI0526085.1 pyridoxal phosphate-dependent transferase [Xylaria bambusicola]